MEDVKGFRQGYGSGGKYRVVVVRGLVVLHATEKALLVIEKDTLDSCRAADESAKEFKKWVPTSQIKHSVPAIRSIDKDDLVEIHVPQWLAEEKEFMYDEV